MAGRSARTTRSTKHVSIDEPSRAAVRARALLLDERRRLTRLHTDLWAVATSRPDFEPHDIVDDEAALQADAVDRRLAAVEEALQRFDSGDFGRCTVCRSPIADERLEALPATPHCVRCAS